MLRKFIGSDVGNIAILFAGGMAVSAVVAAFAVDAASLYYERRVLQSAVDLAAITAAQDPERAISLAFGALVDARLVSDGVTLEELRDPDAASRLFVEIGRYEPDPALTPQDRFVADAEPVNAVRVVARKPGRVYFASSWSPMPVIGASAVATMTPQVAFSVGSRLARLKGGIANEVLSALLGTSADLSLADYNALASVEVDLLGFMDALAGELDIEAGTYADLLALTATHGEIAGALADLLDGAAGAAVRQIADLAAMDEPLPLARLLDLGNLGDITIGSGGENLFAGVSALDLLGASAVLADGSRQIDLGLTAGIPNLAGIDLALVVGEPPVPGAWFAVGPGGTIARTAQVRLRITARVLGGAALLGAGVTLPLYLDIAHAEAQVVSARCPAQGRPNGSAIIAARPGLLRLSIGSLDEYELADPDAVPRPAKLVDIRLLGITGSASAEIAAPDPMELSFSSADIANAEIKTVTVPGLVDPLVGSLLDGLDLDIDIRGIGLGTPVLLTGVLRALLAPVAPVLDAVVMQALDAIGLSLGEADVRVYGVTCNHPVLVG